ncbi:MAG TPA: alpha/beta fold hydrolase [Bryobacteraceae bacterium]|jgi:enterochelin esterase-like enzyme
MRITLPLLLPLAFAAAYAADSVPSGAAIKGTVEKIKVHGKSLEGNLEGDSPDRDVFVYLPPSYNQQANRRYPVVYFLHGYGVNAERYWNMMTVPETADKLMGAGTAHEMILVHPDAFTIYNGSMYSNSPTTGDWEAFIVRDLVSYIDSHYRTIATREGRGLAGHSMGGYGTVRLGMKHPEVFSALYAMSSCCLMNNPQPRPAAAAANQTKQGRSGAFAKVLSAEAAAWSPNPRNPPEFFDLPEKDGTFHPEVAALWIANSPLAMVDQYVPNLKQYHAIAMECGLQDGLIASNKQLDETLVKLGVPHTFETYEGDHTNRVKERFEMKVLPFFSENLK